ncbi:hypothetical protein MPSEU_000290700 [Mayamaea pseudoterrestris]|nr:hypothetical protein MPSEU_000290700 [Mayamaea pseudoterrestris]
METNGNAGAQPSSTKGDDNDTMMTKDLDQLTPPTTKEQQDLQAQQSTIQVTNLEVAMNNNVKSAPHKNRQRCDSRASDRATPIGDRPSIDTHPYPRSSVIEVWRKDKQPQDQSNDEEDWWSDSDTSEEENDKNNSNDENAADGGTINKSNRCILLADIIDRAVIDNGSNVPPTYRYYVHYRDLNRRMDEWITIDRIVSPPSIGNAKARALKRLEEKQKKLEQLRKDEQAVELAANLIGQGPRSRRKLASGGATPSIEDSGGRTSRRASRRKGDDNDDNYDDDDGTVMASNQQKMLLDDEDYEEGVKEVGHHKKEVVELKTETVTTHTVGGHIVATVHAQELDEHEGLDEASLREHEEVTKVKNVSYLELGEFQMETWYYSPFPKELIGSSGFLDVLYVCEFTFGMFARKSELQRYQSRILPPQRHPPGSEIYRKGNLAMFEVDGQEEKIYCQNLCYIAKLFLDHKTLYFDVDPFLFYVLCEVDNRGFHPVGYFSKEKYSDVGFNLACILSFPSQQRKGYGRFLIAFSYALSQKEEKVGSPEKPMSDLGQQAYKPYWASTVLDFLLNQSDESSLSIMDISKKTSIMAEDIVYTLNMLGILKIINGVYFIAAERNLLIRLAEKYPVKEPRVDPSKLHWTPFLTDVKRDKFSIHAKKPSVETNEAAVGEVR